MLTCGEVGSDVHALIKEFAIRLVEHRSETHSNESQHLAKETEVARLWRRLSFCFTAGTSISYASPYLQTGGGACEHSTAPFARTGACTSASYRGDNRVRGTEGTNGVGGGNGDGNGVGGGNGDVDGDGDVGGDGDGDGAGAGTGTGVEVNEGARDGDGSGNEAGTGTGTGVTRRRRSVWERGRERGLERGRGRKRGQ